MVIIFGLLGFVVGYIQQDFRMTFYFLATGGGTSAVICLPDWPWWNRHPLKWLESAEEEDVVDEKVEKKKKKKVTKAK
eukprot:CAMPEP_0174707714 /NCGR_PEP_ID=MMETSP1094-20130205/10153_1 /TAXON_ID=156173 /ORGANISM="Chrysochromulina brevifilum, Strain UTEX LB 985" /LENGTH=77 /DNA_ID=CAMNT_0015906139 /DNA_START=193 /DNA_END=426 /DNA_ORIENTATION=+